VVGVEFLRVDNGFDPRLVGLAVQLEVLASAAGAAGGGWLADALGRRRVFYAFGVLYFLSLLALSLAPRVTSLVVAAYVSQSLASTGMNTLLRITGAEIFPSDRRATGLAWAELAMTLAASGTVALLGWITAGRALFGVEVDLSRVIVGVAVLAAAALPLFALLPETRGVRLEEV
jgi:major inositol transporter-like SP family MFS transporter